MRLIKTYDFMGIKGFELGWSLLGRPLMTVYCYVLGDLMLDTGQSHMQDQACRIAQENNVKRILLTHHHEDHSGNAAAIKKIQGTRVFGHALTQKKMSARFRILPYQKYVWGRAHPLEMETLPGKIETDMGSVIPFHTPGHSKDHTVFFLEDQGVLFSGDLYLADRIKFFRADEDMGAQIESLKKILSLDFDILLCCHYPKTEQGRERVQKKLEFLEDLYGRIILLWEKGMQEKEIFKTLHLKEDYFTQYFCFGNVSMINGVRSAIRHYEADRGS